MKFIWRLIPHYHDYRLTKRRMSRPPFAARFMPDDGELRVLECRRCGHLHGFVWASDGTWSWPTS